MRDKFNSWNYKRLQDHIIPVTHSIYGIFSPWTVRDGNQFTVLTQDVGYPTANMAFYYPMFLPKEYLVDYVFCHTGSIVNGNADIGIYDARTLKRIFSSGSTALSGSAQRQKLNISGGPKLLKPGSYYFGIAVSTTSVHISGHTLQPSFPEMSDLFQEASAFPLPETMSRATIQAHDVMWLIGIGRNLT